MEHFQIIMPVFQTPNIFLCCMHSLLNTIQYPTELIIINDGSNFNCIDIIHKNLNIPEYVKFKYIQHERSMGCPKSINQGLNHVKDGSYVVFADSDIIFCPDWQVRVISTLNDSSIGAVSGIFLYPQSDGIQCCGIAYQNHLARHVYLNNKLANLSLDPIFDVQATIFAFLALNKDLIPKVGYIDENFFNGYEDIDYQFRIRSTGYRIVTNTTIKLYHFEKSNGIHRHFSRKQNLGVFWSKHASEVKNDLCFYLEKQLTSHKISDQHYVLINMCEAQNDANEMITFLKRNLSIETVYDVSSICNIEKKIVVTRVT